jgi:phosphoglucan, water dikinase
MGLLVQGNEKSRSWREKLAFVHELLTDEAVDLDPEKLTYLAIYLRFVGTGEIPTREEGGHHRPSHHARTAGRIHARLAEIAKPENRFILRRIYPWLPSFRSDFTRAEPLTRIRDIAHRDDIPQDLKQEIKHTLQNKLHGNAGPEDLATSENLLEKITAPGSGYPEPFIHEFMKFHEELKEFFHARSLEQDLSSLSSQGEERGDFIHRFLDAKKKGETRQGLVEALEALTALRDHFARDLQKSDPQTQAVQMADIRLEDYAFVLLSRLADSLDPKEEIGGKASGLSVSLLPVCG